MHISAIIHIYQVHGLVQECSNSCELAMELLQSCTKLSTIGCETHSNATDMKNKWLRKQNMKI